ncbi:hypothetical protein PENSPDRAFT_40958 [Peniophora sp. CONT]|nr:hypothetical protein PENSPDRAFT_40958 [Peniophora sp. CONT]
MSTVGSARLKLVARAYIKPWFHAHNVMDPEPPSLLSSSAMDSSYKAPDLPHGSLGAGSSQTVYEQGLTSSNNPDSETRGSRQPLQRRRLVSLPMALHLGVLAFHISLWIIRARNVASHHRVPLDWVPFVQNNINVIPHYIMVAFSTAIVYLMRPIAILSVFSRLPQPLTTLSDKMAAWNGLGAALSILYQNLRYRVALTEVIVITAYFATLTGLGTSSSYIFNLPYVNSTISLPNTTWLGAVPVDALLPPGLSEQTPSNFSEVRFDWYMASLALESSFYVNEEDLAGVDPYSNRVFDTLSRISPLDRPGTAQVNFTEFHVKCGSVPQVSLSATANPSGSTGVGLQDGNDPRLPTLLSINYNLDSQSMNLVDSLNISLSNTSNAISGLWQPSSR